MTKYENIVVKTGLYSILTYIIYTLFWPQAFVIGFITDMEYHIARIMPIIRGEYYCPHSMLHYMVYWIHSVFEWLGSDMMLHDVMIWVQIVCFLLILELTHQVMKFYLKDKYSYFTLLIIATTLMFVISIYTPGFYKLLYYGKYSPNTWHNPTTFLIKPIAICCFMGMYLYIKEYELTKNKLFLIVLSALFTLGIWAKPSFAITYYPALFLFVVIYHTKEYKLYLKIFLILLPSLILLAFQYINTYYAALDNTSDLKDNIILTFFGFTRLWTKHVFISLLLAIAFPLSVIILDFKNAVKNRLLIFTWLFTLIGYLQVSFLAEKIKFKEGAFVSGYNYSLFFLFIFSMIHFLNFAKENTKEKEQLKSAVILAIYCMHLLSGVYYYFHYLSTESFF